MKSISILGCGWLGLALARALVVDGYSVRGSTTDDSRLKDLEDAGIRAYLLRFDPQARDDVKDFFESDALFLNIPPPRRSDVVTYFEAQTRAVCAALEGSSVRRVLFASSTSVYPDLNREVTETEKEPPVKQAGIALRAAEDLLLASPDFQTTIIRFAGLIGYDRHPGRFLAGRTAVPNGDAPVNLIHRDDCVAIVRELLCQQTGGEIFNACMDDHPTRSHFYRTAALRAGLEPPSFATDEETHFKLVNNRKLKEHLQYTFRHPSPLGEMP